MNKFVQNGIRGVMQHWFESYLSNRKQYISIKNCMQFLYLKHYIGCSTRLGVEPITFSFVYQWHVQISNQMRFVHFADDATVFASNSDISNVHATVNRKLVGVDNWLKANRLSLNVSKTSKIIISNQKYAIVIRVRDSILTKVSTVKFLGVTKNLTFNDHVKNVN